MNEGFSVSKPIAILGAILLVWAASSSASERRSSAIAGNYTGARVVPSNFDVSEALVRSWGNGAIAPKNGKDTVGAFRFICGAGQVRYDDPIVYPGQPGRSHLHQFYGNTAADANSTFASLRQSGDSTCNNVGNGTAANRSAYWMPAMLDGKGNVVLPDYVQVYYKREPIGGPQCDPASPTRYGICLGIPNGIRFIQGFDQLTGKHSIQPGWFSCRGNGAANAVWKQNAEAMSLMSLATCPVGSHVEMAIQSLKCWNGELDSTNHIAHLSGMKRDASTNRQPRCPDSHPYYIAQFTISAFFSVKAGDDPALWSLASDAMFPALKRGATLHFDYFEAWDNSVKNMWVDNCIGRKLNCSGGDLGNGKQLKGAAKPKYGWKNPDRLVPIPQGGMM